MTPIFEVNMDQGADFYTTVNWYGGGIFRASIEEINPGYPTLIRVTAHGLPTASLTPIIISGVQGAEILNSQDTAIELCETIDDDHFEVPVSTVPCEWVQGTGEITYHMPADITNYTARCQLRSKWHSGTAITAYTTDDATLVLNANDASIQLFTPAAITAGLSFTKAYGDIELIAPGGAITRVARIIVNFSREMTK